MDIFTLFREFGHKNELYKVTDSTFGVLNCIYLNNEEEFCHKSQCYMRIAGPEEVH